VRQLSALQSWADGTSVLADLVASELESQTFQKIFLQDIGNACCNVRSMEDVVNYLQSAEAECSEDGWTCLDSAIRYLVNVGLDEVPRKYGCRTWRQLLARLEQFEIRVEKGHDTKRGRTWYRSRAKRSSG